MFLNLSSLFKSVEQNMLAERFKSLSWRSLGLRNFWTKYEIKNVSQFGRLLLLTKINFRDQKCFSVLIHFLFQLSKSMLTEVFCLRSLGLFWKIILRQMFELISLFDEFSKGKIAWLIYYTLFEIIIKKKCFSLLLHHGRLNLIAQCSMFEYQFRNVDYWMSQQN